MQMKKSCLVYIAAILLLAACKEKPSNESHEHNADGSHPAKTHTHEDGTVHEPHSDTVHQEEFRVGKDSLTKESGASSKHKH